MIKLYGTTLSNYFSTAKAALVAWLYIQGTNPSSCSSIASLTSVAFTVVVSKATRPLPESHVRALFEGVYAYEARPRLATLRAERNSA